MGVQIGPICPWCVVFGVVTSEVVFARAPMGVGLAQPSPVPQLAGASTNCFGLPPCPIAPLLTMPLVVPPPGVLHPQQACGKFLHHARAVGGIIPRCTPPIAPPQTQVGWGGTEQCWGSWGVGNAICCNHSRSSHTKKMTWCHMHMLGGGAESYTSPPPLGPKKRPGATCTCWGGGRSHVPAPPTFNEVKTPP